MPTATLKRQRLFKNVDGKNCVRFHFGERGSAYLPQTMVQPLLDAGQLHRVSEVNDWQRPLYLSYRKNSSSIEAIVQVEKLMKTLDPFSVVRTVGKVEAV